jgi:ribosomal-protein-alanine N-acetyltransferase
LAEPADNSPVLLTPRLRLRRVEPRDADALHACFSDPEAMRYWDLPPSPTMAETEKILRWLTQTASPYDHLAWAVADRRGDQCMGMVCYHHREARNRRLELGYILAPAHHGRGLGTEAVGALVDYCVGTLGAHRIQALIEPENRASIALVERLGFRCEGGPLADYWRVGDRYRSAMLYALVAPAADAGTATTDKKRHHGRPRKTGRPGA